jgi:uncharacterized membrane protein YebE (DUF533 family)
MDVRSVLEHLLGAGQAVASQSKEFAEKRIGVPDAGPSRDAMLSGLGKGAAIGGILALLLGTKTGRKVSGKAIQYGSLAALAAVAYKAYQTWQKQSSASQAGPEIGTSVVDLTGKEADDRNLLLLRAMIAAANADGHIDQDERQRIASQMKELAIDDATVRLVEQEIQKPDSPEDLARVANSPAAASEVYLISSLIIDDSNAAEREYMQRLASALRIPRGLVQHLESQVVS